MKHSNYTEHGIEGPFTPPPTLADKVLFWLSGFVCGLVFTLLITEN